MSEGPTPKVDWLTKVCWFPVGTYQDTRGFFILPKTLKTSETGKFWTHLTYSIRWHGLRATVVCEVTKQAYAITTGLPNILCYLLRVWWHRVGSTYLAFSDEIRTYPVCQYKYLSMLKYCFYCFCNFAKIKKVTRKLLNNLATKKLRCFACCNQRFLMFETYKTYPPKLPVS